MLSAITALVLVGTIAAVFYLLGQRDGGGVAVGAAGRPAVAVATFENPRGAKDVGWLTTGLPGMLVTGLGQTPGLDVVGAARVEEVIQQAGMTGGVIDRSRILEVGRRAGAGAIVMGSVFQAGADFRIDVQVQDVGSGKLLGGHSVRGTDIFALADDLTARILHDLNVTTDAKPVAEVTTNSSDAYRFYSEGTRAMRLLRRSDARKLLEQAVGIDPTFASAWLDLATVAAGIDDRRAEADRPVKMFFSMGGPSTSLVRNSYPFRDGTARVLAARGDLAGAITAYQRLLTLDLTQKWTSILEPRLVLQLARLLERQGNAAAAREQYGRFLHLWKAADTGLPEVAEARRKIPAGS
jgi:TolB-like protein